MTTQPSTCSVSSVGGETFSDALYNYEVHEEMGQGATAIVYRATCKRGRLRNRQVALKKIFPPTTGEGEAGCAHLTSSASLHQALHHPSIVSLLSTFSTSTDHYQVLELCSRGTLSDFLHSRTPSTLSEDELRGIVKTMVDALMCLRKERIIHRDIKASNILLTDDFRIKLSDFGLATQLPTLSSTTSTFCGSPSNVAPEIISHLPYGFAVDLWSLGCLMVTCLSGIPAFEAPSVSEIFNKISYAKYSQPENISAEARSLISGLLQVDPDARLSLHQVLSHPFLSPTFRIQPLSIPSTLSFQPPGRTQTENAFQNFPKPKRYPQSLSKMPSEQHPSERAAENTQEEFTHSRKPMADIANLDLRNVLSNEFPRALRLPAASWTRRVVSAPQSGRTSTTDHLKPYGSAFTARILSVPATPALTVDSGSLPSTRSITTVVESYDLGLNKRCRSPIAYPLIGVLGRRDVDGPLPKNSRSALPSVVKEHSLKSLSIPEDTKHTAVALPSGHSSLRLHRFPPVSAVSASSNCPTIFTSSYLNPQTHKVSQGQLVVLPSQSILVDFREGERRKGRKGDKVIVVSPNGMMISIYSAPHLSTPCCLAEPDATYSVGDLPGTYCKSYNDAARLVNQLKQRVPKLVLHKPEANFILMANEPHGDIEIHISPIDPPHNQSRRHMPDIGSLPKPSMRVRLSRQRHAVEIARHVPSATQSKSRGGEWTKKVISTAGDQFAITDDDWDSLEPLEHAGLGHLAYFLRVCESVEALDNSGHSTPGSVSKPEGPIPDTTSEDDDDPSYGRRRLAEVLGRMENRAQARPQSALSDRLPSSDCTEGVEGLWSTEATTASTKVLPSISLPPRPSRISMMPTTHRPWKTPGATRRPQSVGAASLDVAEDSSSPEAIGISSVDTSTPTTVTPQTKFIPSIGWCIRYEVAGTELYRIMFHDGTSMVVDTWKGTAQITTVSGETSRMPLRDSTRDMLAMERMEAFKKFVNLFA
ncbi:kinase-like domain-containing protein [Amylocystis lapponica]|nr:kinase-like domain-containing protein [Amylocystis lapponica]